MCSSGPVPNCDFYAAGQDLLDVLSVVFALGDCLVFEAYSPPGEDLREFKTVEEIRHRYALGLCEGRGPSVLLQLYAPSAAGAISRRRIDLKPQGGVTEARFRYTMEGWGLIQLQLGGVFDGGLVASHTNHNSKARAVNWENTCPEMGPASAWNWAEVFRVSRRINTQIRTKLSVGKIGSRSVLPQAEALLRAGSRVL